MLFRCRCRLGLSPLARGTPIAGVVSKPSARFIPAGAGNTPAVVGRSRCSTVYPRWRGEHICCCCAAWACSGLSPLARGTPHMTLSYRYDLRFIPAGAGNTHAVARPSSGQHGLSPLARGTPQYRRDQHRQWRFIPAGAGNTHRPSKLPTIPPVYPRWRGEHSLRPVFNALAAGLSPLARGTHPHDDRLSISGRFIPAGAGNTSAR